MPAGHGSSQSCTGPSVADLSACRDDLHDLLATAIPATLRARSKVDPMEQRAAAVPPGVRAPRRPTSATLGPADVGTATTGGRGFACALDAGRMLFHWVDYTGSCGGVLVFNRTRMGWLCDRTIDHLVASLEREPERRLIRGMPFPTSWDPYFQPFMTLADVDAYPVLHYAHHRAQLTLATT